MDMIPGMSDHPVSEQLRRAVRTAEKTRYRISKETGIAQSILCRFVNEGAGMSLESIDRLCECLGLRLTGPAEAKANKTIKPKRKGAK